MANEKRLIDANEQIKWLEDNTEDKEWLVSQYNADWICSMLESAPTVDAVEVVRCKDCHWWRHINKKNGCGICRHEVFYIDDPTTAPATEPNDFCSYGERRTDGETERN